MWTIRHSEYIYKSRWITVRKDAVRTDKDIDVDDFYVLEYPTWVNVIAITQEGKFIIEQQYRHGIQQHVYELCAGTCEANEKPIDAAKREVVSATSQYNYTATYSSTRVGTTLTCTGSGKFFYVLWNYV